METIGCYQEEHAQAQKKKDLLLREHKEKFVHLFEHHNSVMDSIVKRDNTDRGIPGQQQDHLSLNTMATQVQRQQGGATTMLTQTLNQE